MRSYTEYKVSVGYGDNTYETKQVKVLNGSMAMMQTIKSRLQTKWGSFAWVKFERLINAS